MNEEWEIIKIKGHNTNFIINRFGIIFNIKTKRILKGSKNKKGYVMVNLSVKNKSYKKSIHRLVAKYFVPGYNKNLEVNHKDGDKEHNFADNLEWVTGKENIHHAVINNLMKHKTGVDAYQNIHSEETIHSICKLLENGYTIKKISEMYPDVNYSTIYNIQIGRSWVEISKQYKIPELIKKKIFSYLYPIIDELLKGGMSNVDTYKTIKEKYDERITKSVIKNRKRKLLKERSSTTIESDYVFIDMVS